MMQASQRLSSKDRLLLAASAVALVGVFAALQCAALSVDTGARSALSAASMLLAALIASVLVEDSIGASLRALVRRPALPALAG